MRVFSYKKIALLGIIVLFSLLISLVIMKLVSVPPNATLVKNEWQLFGSDNKLIKTLPNPFIYKINKEKSFKPGIFKLKTDFHLPYTMPEAYVVLTQQPDNGFRIYIDGNYITEVGDISNGNGNIWKDSGIFKIPNGLDVGTHVIELELYVLDQLSLLSTPYVFNVKLEPIKFGMIKIINRHIAYFMMGMTTIMGLLFLSLTIINRNENINQTILGISFILWTIYFLDLIPINYTIISYLTFKKMVFVSFSLGYFLNFIVIYRILDDYIKNKYKILLLVLSVITILLILYPKTMGELRFYSRIVRFFCYSLCIPVLLHPKVLFSNDKSINLITVGVVGSLFFAFRYLILDTLGIPYLILRHIGFYFYLLFVFAYFIMDYFTKNKRILEESLRADHYYNKSVIDPLTNINNRNVLHYIHLTEIKYALFICDLDNFKFINDTYGHNIGDEVLIKVSSIIKDTIRESDYAIRIGGDEFVFLLINCPFNKANMIAQTIWSKINSSVIQHGTELVKFGCSGGGTLSEPGEDYKAVLKKADKNLYEIKESSKGTFKFS